jgi:glycosyltransferase involved in cell wall biosynthesis
MRILIFHGYLLRGTGSNVYNANLAQALASLGHDVHLLCQDRRARELPWVDAVGEWKGGALAVERVRTTQRPGSVTVHLPDIGGLLPVFVRDHYEGFRVKELAEMTEAEVDSYLAANVAAVTDVVERIGAPDAALANHLVMGSTILARVGLRFASKVHGSDLSYAVRPQPRFVPFAREAMEGATAALVGSRHTAESLWEALPDLHLEEKTRLGPPGVDPAEFAPRPPAAARAALLELAEQIEGTLADDAFGRDPAAAAAALRSWARVGGPRVVFVGKLIVSKGVDLLLAAWPLVHAANPGASLLMVGFGAYERGLRRLLAALKSGDFGEAREVARLGRGLEGGEEVPLRFLQTFLERPPQGYTEAAAAAAGSVLWAGRLEHGEVAEVLPGAEALVMPSTFPEAFGMVAVEAASCGALPISAGHSGMLEVSHELAVALPPEVGRMVSFPLDDSAVAAIAERLTAWLAMPPNRRRELGATLAGRVEELWSWEAVANGVIAASQGRLDELPLVPEVT